MLSLDVSREQLAVNKRFFRHWCTLAIRDITEKSSLLCAQRVCKLADGIEPTDVVVRIAMLCVECAEDIVDKQILEQIELIENPPKKQKKKQNNKTGCV
jgi:hypothetical protein